MKYMGSKNRIAKDILPIIFRNHTHDQFYVEPFVGGCNLIDKVNCKRIGNDAHYYLIEMYKAFQSGWTPPKYISKDEWEQAKLGLLTGEFKDALTGYIGFNASFGGMYFTGYANPRPDRDYTEEAYRNVIKQIPQLIGIQFHCGSYDKLDIPKNSLIYCDPPYKNTAKYKTDDFNHDKFYDWCRLMKSNGHTIFISEYTMPDDFICVFEKKQTSSLSSKNKNSIERLFTI